MSERDDRHIAAARRLLEHLAGILDIALAVRLWDGSIVPLGNHADPVCIAIHSPGTVGGLLRRPTADNLARLYATGAFTIDDDRVMELATRLRERRTRRLLRQLDKSLVARTLWPFLLTRSEVRQLGGHLADRGGDPIRFHYDVGNDFYALFLDPEMQYSCAYFTDWQGSLEQAQRAKLDMICRKLRLQPGERFLDIGCGWGGLLCHAARHYGVEAHGVTLSEAQHTYARERIAREGLDDRVTVELRDYREVGGTFDKIASIGMYEHLGIRSYEAYFGKLRGLLRERGLLLNHGITRRAKAASRAFRRLRPEKRLILKYVFPGSELDHIGHTVQVMEACGFEVHDVEDWREHYAITTRLWCERLRGRREEARALVGPERLRMWLAYLAGVSVNFDSGSLLIYQTLASRRAPGPSGLPPTRADLYR